ncbi:hypothetical protein [Erythrobacter sp. THAF29]|uniref:hypothetical protein n=1 Tax=Erythrobacter sp. THAF29 TaxID=2587851 RepID=UPI00126857D1|nr:hypothetical protein [Erythrobacter sp. THAF29]QFT77271.1 hypothetical protein FIU90_06925 [Erythrobacter sp. THAF29]
MSKLVTDHLEQGKARIVEAPSRKIEIDRSFGLPTALYGTTVGLYFAVIAILAAGFGNPGLTIPMAIFALFIVAAFGVPALFTRLKGNDSKPLTMGKFSQEGIVTYTGRLAPRDATIQMLILPVLVVLWACAVVTIAALV